MHGRGRTDGTLIDAVHQLKAMRSHRDSLAREDIATATRAKCSLTFQLVEHQVALFISATPPDLEVPFAYGGCYSEFSRRLAMTTLENRFDSAMMTICQRAYKETGHRATRFFQMLSDNGGLETARILLHANAVSDGYTAMWECGRLDLTVEALIFDHPEYHPLFTADELARARARLQEYRYEPALA